MPNLVTRYSDAAGNAPGSLLQGEMAINVADTPPKLYVGDGANVLAVGPVIVATAAPASPPAGTIWLDTNTDDVTMWNGTVWAPMGGGGGLTIADTAPANPDVGDLWMDSSNADFATYAWYDDGTSQQWILQSSPSAGVGNFVKLSGDTMTGPLEVPAGATGNQVPRANEVVPLAGGVTMTGLLTLSGPPTAANHAVTKTYADTLPFLASSDGSVGDVLLMDEATYNALPTKDPNTIYFVVP